MMPIDEIEYLAQSIMEDCVSIRDGQTIRSAIDRPEFEGAGKVHDWRNHVPDKIKEVWNILDDESRVVAFYMAELEADREEWD